METPDTFQLLNLTIDPATKAISSPHASLQSQLDALNVTHRQLLSLDTPNQAPPPPLPVKPTRSQNLQKLRDSAVAAMKKRNSTAGTSSSGVPQNISEAIKLWTLVVEMALQRPGFEPSGLQREEAAMAYGGRSEAYAAARQWSDALTDAKLSVECKKAGNAKAWLRGGKALAEMGRRAEAKSFAQGGLDGEEQALQGAKQQFEQMKAQLQQAHAQGQQVPPQALAQAKQIETAVKGQEEAIAELKDFLKDFA